MASTKSQAATAPATRGKPGPKPRVSRDEILDIALGLLAGTGALSIRRLASELDMTPMSVYGYFASKEDLEDAVVERVMPAPPETIDPDVAWDEQLKTYVLEIHDAFAARPGAAEFLAARSTGSRSMNDVREHLLRLLIAGGLSDADAINALGAISRYLMGCVAIESERREEPRSEADRLSSLPKDRFPTLARVAGLYAERGSQESTRFGIDLLISSLRTLSQRGR